MHLTIQNNLLSAVAKIVTAGELEQVFNDPETFQKVTQIRQFRKAGNMKKATDVKHSLPGIIFVADDFAETEKDGVTAKWRLQKSAHLNGLAVIDADHLTEHPRDIFSRWTEEQLKSLGIYLIFITSSEEGMKVVFKARKEWGNLIDNAIEMGRQLGLKADESCKDASRMSFAPSRQAGDILYFDAEGMFAQEDAEYDQLFGEDYRQGKSGSKDKKVRSSEVRDFNIADYKYKGVEVQKIVDCWIGSDIPQEGERHKTSLALADELRYITDSDPVVIEGILRAQPWVADIVKERGENVGQTVKSALGYREEKRIPKRMYHALIDAGVPMFSGISASKLPYEDWYQRLRKIRLGCYKSAIAYIDSDWIKTGGVVISGGMYATLLTDCWYQDWEGYIHRLNANAIAIGKPASGKGFATKQDEYIMEVMRREDAEGREEERLYKEGLNERETSQKEQKKDALKRPTKSVRYCPVKTSNNVFYRRMENAKVMLPDGTFYYRHLYTFASELLSIVKAAGNFQEKRDMMLQAFHNEMNGVDYANKDSVNAVMPMYFNLVATGTSTSLKKFVNPQNIGDGLSTRLSCFLMPDEHFKMRPYRSKPRSMEAANEMKHWGEQFASLKGEVKGVGKLTNHIYKLTAMRAEEAASCNDQATLKMCMRMQDKVMAICLPLVLSTQKSWDEVQRTMTVSITQQHLDFATLIYDVLLSCEDALFGQLWQDYFDNEERDTQLRTTTNKTAQFYSMLPENFTTADVRSIWGYSSKSTASDKCKELVDQKIVKKVSQGHYQKLVSAI